MSAIRVIPFLCAAMALAICGCPKHAEEKVVNTHVVLAWNDLGMHCMNQDFSEMMILPPYNTLHAQVIRRGSEEPQLVTKGVKIKYSFPKNTTSVTKTNFWDYEDLIFGVSLEDDIGLTGNGLTGRMKPTGNNDWSATGIPITPLDDKMKEDPYPLARVKVLQSGNVIAETRAVAPVSWEISCDLCHTTTGISVAKDILRKHDTLHATTLEADSATAPIMCGSCHAQAPLGTTGSPSLSRAMHHSHAKRMDVLSLEVDCYACHPGIRTQCLRDVHLSEGMDCEDCHGDMKDVASLDRQPWVTEPRCDDCHTRHEFEFEQANTLYRDSKGHGGVHCAACHGSPHAITPTEQRRDNVQAIALQGHAGVIDTCTVCHTEEPDESFEHQLFGDDGDDDRLAAN